VVVAGKTVAVADTFVGRIVVVVVVVVVAEVVVVVAETVEESVVS